MRATLPKHQSKPANEREACFCGEAKQTPTPGFRPRDKPACQRRIVERLTAFLNRSRPLSRGRSFPDPETRVPCPRWVEWVEWVVAGQFSGVGLVGGLGLSKWAWGFVTRNFGHPGRSGAHDDGGGQELCARERRQGLCHSQIEGN